jgi:hypothetical protein
MSLKIKTGVSLELAYQSLVQINNSLKNPNETLCAVLWYLQTFRQTAICDYNDLGPDVSYVTLVNVGYKTEMVHRINVVDELASSVRYDVEQRMNFFPLFTIIERRCTDSLKCGRVIGVASTRFETSEDLNRKVLKFLIDFGNLSEESLHITKLLCE